MKYKIRKTLLKLLCVPLVIVTLLIFVPLGILTYALYGVLHVWRWVVLGFIDEELTEVWNEMIESIGIDKLVIEF